MIPYTNILEIDDTQTFSLEGYPQKENLSMGTNKFGIAKRNDKKSQKSTRRTSIIDKIAEHQKRINTSN